MENTKRMPFGYAVVLVLVLLGITLLGRGMGYIYSTMATDVTYSDFAVSIMGILVDLLALARVCIGFGAILYAMWTWEHDGADGRKYRCGGIVTLVVVLMELADCASRYITDSLTSSITGMEVVAILWLLLQFCYSLIMTMLCFVTGRLLDRDRHSLDRAAVQCILYTTFARVLMEVYYLVDFLTTYSTVTATEVSSIAGQFLYTLAVYGGAAVLLVLLTVRGISRFHKA